MTEADDGESSVQHRGISVGEPGKLELVKDEDLEVGSSHPCRGGMSAYELKLKVSQLFQVGWEQGSPRG